MSDRADEYVWVAVDKSLCHAMYVDRPGAFACGKSIYGFRPSAVEAQIPDDDVRCARCDRALKQRPAAAPDRTNAQ